MSNELRERIAELLELLRPATPSEAADAILALPGIAVVELPEPDYVDDEVTESGKSGYGWDGVYACAGSVYLEEDELSPTKARDFAAALLAAADRAEKEKK